MSDLANFKRVSRALPKIARLIVLKNLNYLTLLISSDYIEVSFIREVALIFLIDTKEYDLICITVQ